MTGLLDKDICLYSMDNLSQDIRDHLELSFTAHRTQRPCNKCSQVIALRDLKTHATLSEKHINNLQKLVNSSTTNALPVNNANLPYVVPSMFP